MTSPAPSALPWLKALIPGSYRLAAPEPESREEKPEVSMFAESAGLDIMYSATGAATSTLRPTPTIARSLRERPLSRSMSPPIDRENCDFPIFDALPLPKSEATPDVFDFLSFPFVRFIVSSS